MLNYHS